ncbi:MAG: exodeoxyribonuclease V [Candidatus Dojkabacteria bacterium]|nr:MAG: exodeoxyribonuclease V [Candidatus Dojkabacteria bacterium]
MNTINLSPSQKNTIKDLIIWYNNPSSYITLGGYAGTGKTTVISIFSKILKEKLKTKIAFCSFTGKATQVLIDSLKKNFELTSDDRVSTIHSLIYEPVVDDQKEIVGWTRKKKIDFDLIILDEASMINKRIWQDLLSFKIPIIAVGDHGQLPPIGENFNLLEKPDLRLEEVHRQAQNNPIIKLSMMLRAGKEIPVGKYSDKVKKISSNSIDFYDEMERALSHNLNEKLILCGYNNTRIKINQEIRARLEKYGPPQPGDRVICLKNNHKKNIANGMLGKIIKINDDSEDLFQAQIQMDNGILFEGLVSKRSFNSTENIIVKQRDVDYFDFGYALTTHKAQGSQAKSVVVFEERFKNMDDETWFRWLYTAITRAEEELLIIC